MHIYHYTGAYPAIFSDLSYGPGVAVTSAAGDEVAGPGGSTVTLQPGDTITLEREYVHALLVSAAEETPAAAASTTRKKG